MADTILILFNTELSKNIELPKDPKLWKKKHVIEYLTLKKDELDLDHEDFEIFQKNKLLGSAFVSHTYDELIDKNGEYKLSIGTAKAIISLISELTLTMDNKKKQIKVYVKRDLSLLIEKRYKIICNERTVIKEIPEFNPECKDIKNEPAFNRCIVEIKVFLNKFILIIIPFFLLNINLFIFKKSITLILFE